MSWEEYDQETPDDKLSARQKGKWYNAGIRGIDGLTRRERLLIDTLKQQGFEIRTGRVENVRSHTSYAHTRMVQYG